MKRFALLVLIVTSLLTVNAQKTKHVIPIGSQLDLEPMLKHIDMNQDINRLSLSDLRILRNAFAARQGYCFSDYGLRSVFSQTSWYDSLMCERECGNGLPPLRFTKTETDMMNRIKIRERQLMRENFKIKDDNKVNTDNIVNKFQLEEDSPSLYKHLARYGFTIVPRQNVQLFHCYENNDYHDFPNFITTDLNLQLLHIYFSNLLQDIEENKLSGLIGKFFRDMYEDINSLSQKSKDKRLQQRVKMAAAYCTIGCRLAGDSLVVVPNEYTQAVADELERIAEQTDSPSPFLGYEINFMYSMFKPRGNYTRTKKLQQYFQAMMWLQSAAICIDDIDRLGSFIVMGSVLNNNPELKQTLKSISTPINQLVGQPDGVGLLDLTDIVAPYSQNLSLLFKKKANIEKIQHQLVTLNQQRARIRPKEQISCAEKISILPQRYLYDSEVLQELVDTKTKPTSLRSYPKGLDIMAAFGSNAAEQILINELKEGQKWPHYIAKLDSVKQLMPQLSCDTTSYNLWMSALTDMTNAKEERYPYFMQTSQWGKKNLNTALASWAELKHDVILYAKQPMAAECGGCLPDPVVVGYVEPNIAYWKKAHSLMIEVMTTLDRGHLLSDKMKAVGERIVENLEFLQQISEKELSKQKLTESEFGIIEKMGSSYEWLTMDILKPDSSYVGMMWQDVQGPSKSVSVVADVYTSNASNNPSQGVLEVGVGFVDDIYVVVEINGLLHLTRGAVFSYREFPSSLNNRLTDEEWQHQLELQPRKGVPSWMNEIIIPTEVPADNETYFYGSGC